MPYSGHTKRAVKLALLLATVVFSQWSVTASAEEQRIITAGGTLTDVVFALGGSDDVIAVDTSSTSPAAAQRMPKVGYYRNLSAEGVLSFNPTDVWVMEGAGSEGSLEQIEKTGVAVTQFAKPTTLPAFYQFIEAVAESLNRSEQAGEVIKRIKQDFHPVAEGKGLTALFLLQVSERGVVAAGNKTVPNLLFNQVKVANVFDHQGYKTVSSEYLLANQPDFIVAPSHVVMAQGGQQAFCQARALQLLEAGKACRVLVMDSLLAMGMTTRIAEAQQILVDYIDELPK